MGDLADVYNEARSSIAALVAGLSDDEVEECVPATAGWRIRDVVAHLAGDAACLIVGDFPREFFQAFGDETALVTLNRWTSGHVESRSGSPVAQILDEWEASAATLTEMMRGEREWPQDVPPFADRVLITDVGVHQQDIYGALGIVRDRESPPVRIGVAGYIALADMRMRSDDVAPLRIEAAEKNWTLGGEETAATLRTDRFELFRALSGRRNPDQIRAYDWDGDPEPYLYLFYPYGARAEALVE